MRILFSMGQAGHTRNFDSTVRRLASDGHRVHLVFQMPDKLGDMRLVDSITRDFPNVTSIALPIKGGGTWDVLARKVRLSADYLRYLHPRYAGAPKLRERAQARVPRLFQLICRLPAFRSEGGLRFLSRLLLRVEEAVPANAALLALFDSFKPDLLLITPLVDLGSSQVEYVAAARVAGVPSMVLVHSWDNLTNKGLLRIAPDWVAVWNEMQRAEAVELHGIHPDRVLVAGAPCYDQWFAWESASTREQFCARVGLDPDRPILVYLCSSPFIAPSEVDSVKRWIRAVRNASDPVVRSAGILIRPHPQNAEQWSSEDLGEFQRAVVWPKAGSNPIDAGSRGEFYDTLFHSAAVVGVNSSALIEAGIVGRPVFTVLTKEFEGTQTGTLHFQHLVSVSGGLLHVSPGLEEHVAALARALGSRETGASARKGFLESFVRPHGIDVPATPVLVSMIGRVAAAGPGTAREPGAAVILTRVVLAPLLVVLAAYGLAVNWRAGAAVGAAAVKRLSTRLRRMAGYGIDLALAAAPVRRALDRYVVPRLFGAYAGTGGSGGGFQLPHVAHRAAAVRDEFARIARSGRPVVVGPWLGEVGFELLYWVPFLRWAKQDGPLKSSRLIVVSRGGTRAWYSGIADRYSDIFDFMTEEEYRTANMRRWAEAGGKQKQWTVSDLDRRLVAQATQRAGIAKAELLHPSMMYSLFRFFWKRQATERLLEDFTLHALVDGDDGASAPDGLPRDFYAVKFYFNDSFPRNAANVRFVGELVRRLAAERDVVLLSTGLEIDDHEQCSHAAGGRVHDFSRSMTPRDNLAVQTAIVRRSKALICTYGGFAYLGPLCGVPAVAFTSHFQNANAHHLELAQRVFAGLGTASLVVVDTRDAGLLGSLLTSGPASRGAAGATASAEADAA